jgi:hypothetical protein
MNRERAETRLRLLAEDELRRAVTRAWDGRAGACLKMRQRVVPA